MLRDRPPALIGARLKDSVNSRDGIPDAGARRTRARASLPVLVSSPVLAHILLGSPLLPLQFSAAVAVFL